MGIIVNTNVASITAQRNLSKSSNALQKSLQRLSSGLRINSAGDDAAGLAIATSLQSQIRGLTQATRNANDGLSVAGTAEGAMGTITDILQRVRELAVQSANDINSGTNRQAIQDEIDAQVAEITRLGNTTEFNGQLLLNGSFSNKNIQIGAMSSQSIAISLSDFRGSSLGKIATTTSTNAVDTTALAAGNITINGVSVGASTGLDTLSTTSPDGSAIAKAAAINAVTAQTGVTAKVLATTSAGQVGAATAVPASANTLVGDTLTINGTQIFGGTIFAIQQNDADGVITSKINAKSNLTGVTASVSGGAIVFSAADGRNINVVASAGTTTRMNINSATFTAKLKFTSSENFTMSSSVGTRLGFVGAGVTITSATVDPTTAISSIDVTTAAGAATAIDTIDAALAQSNTARASLGAFTNRLENTITNLQTTIENLSASQSRIMDADFAVETANMTRAQILQQAGTAVLSQANVTPQAALTLLGR